MSHYSVSRRYARLYFVVNILFGACIIAGCATLVLIALAGD